MVNSRRKINANPTKDFFIYMITRDIDLKDAILELIDNCVDGATRLRGRGSLSGLLVNISISDNEFSITDNCGGIPINIAEQYAFRFGRPEDSDNKIDYSTGIFGIGMKRALLKLGGRFSIESTTKEAHFIVNVDVNEWKKDDEKWDFYFDVVEEGMNNEEQECGTKILVSNIYEGISSKFRFESFYNELKTHIEQHVANSLEKGLSVCLNGIPLKFNTNEIFVSDQISPAFEEFTINDVNVKIYAGLGETGDPKSAGWYVYCNGRLILEANHDEITGWGEDGVPQFHPDFARFRGFVFFESKDSDKLPWNTTKTGVDTSSSVFIAAKLKMKNIFKSVKDFLRKLKSAEEEVKDDLEEIIDKSKKIRIEEIDTSNATNQFVINLNIPKGNPIVTISYKRLKSEADKVKELLNATNYRQVGEKTFEYFLQMECEE